MYVYTMHLQDQYTPLFAASARGFNEVAKSLLAANADVNCICKVSCYIRMYTTRNHVLNTYCNFHIRYSLTQT